MTAVLTRNTTRHGTLRWPRPPRRRRRPGSTTLTVPSGGLARTVVVHVHAGYDPSHRTPLVVNLHGSGTTAARQKQFTGMDATADCR